ncbi:MAG TPA: hypothetical protein VF474_05390 [Phenylobacterium sp.]
MRLDQLHIPRGAWPHFAWRRVTPPNPADPHGRKVAHPPAVTSRTLSRADLLALVLAGTLAAAVTVALLMQL